MGCTSEKERRFNVEEHYRNKGLPLPDGKEFENNFEKEAFMTINLLRLEPKIFISHIRDIKSNTFPYSIHA